MLTIIIDLSMHKKSMFLKKMSSGSMTLLERPVTLEHVGNYRHEKLGRVKYRHKGVIFPSNAETTTVYFSTIMQRYL